MPRTLRNQPLVLCSVGFLHPASGAGMLLSHPNSKLVTFQGSYLLLTKNKKSTSELKDFIGFVKRFVNQVPSRLASRRVLPGFIQNERFFWEEGVAEELLA